MNGALYMLEICLDAGRLAAFLQSQGINTTRNEDLGYDTHAWLRATFGDKAPKPYRVMFSSGRLRILGYAATGHSTLIEHAQAYAEPLAASVLGDSPQIFSKQLTLSLAPGKVLGFELLICPVTRKEDRERDVYLRRLDSRKNGSPRLAREHVYVEWLETQLQGAARLLDARMVGFRLVQLLRRSHDSSARKRKSSFLTRPDVLIRGRLAISDTNRFQQTLVRGIGRHRSFGYGMLLLRPPS